MLWRRINRTRNADGWCERKAAGLIVCMQLVCVTRRMVAVMTDCYYQFVGGRKSGGKPDDQPDGLLEACVVDSMLGTWRDSFAIDRQGFPYRDLHHGDWLDARKKQLAWGYPRSGYWLRRMLLWEYQKNDRPVLTFIMKAARLGLWVMMFVSHRCV